MLDKKGAKLVLNTEVLANWNTLNPAERYFELFYAWWHRGSDEILGERCQWLGDDNYFFESADFFHNTLGKSLDIKTSYTSLDSLRYRPGLHNLALMELFGFIRIELNSLPSKENWPIEKITPTTWGSALLKCFSKEMGFLEGFPLVPLNNQQNELWGSEAKSYIPTWEKSLDQAVSNENLPTTVILKVSLGKVYRTLSIPHTLSLDELAACILSAFNFSKDHLYEFIFKNDYGLTERIVHSYVDSDDVLLTSEYLVSELPLYEGMELTFHYDFGDDWRFLMLVESFTDEESSLLDAKVIKQYGNPPEQYPEWDDDI